MLPGLHRPAHPLRRAALLGPGGLAVEPARRHHVIAGNCGFTLAPLAPGDGDYTRRMMAKVEGMPLAALEEGVDWDWETFAEYLDRLDGNIGVNAGFLVGHCALRRRVMGTEAVGNEATPEEIDADGALLASRSRPAASASPPPSPARTPTATAAGRLALGDQDELLALASVGVRARGHHASSTRPTAASTASTTTRSSS
jgi:hypothetical protein